VSAAERRGEAVLLSCSDSDAAIRALLRAHADARDIEIAAAALEEAFVELTGDGAPHANGAAGAGAAAERMAGGEGVAANEGTAGGAGGVA
jgi:ABC-2 type transport system ATP-binding protein